MCLEYRKDRRFKNIPFICCSENLLSNPEMHKYEVDEVLTKPFCSANEVLEVVFRHLNPQFQNVRLSSPL